MKKQPQKGSLATEKDPKKLKRFRTMFLIYSILFTVLGIIFCPFLIVGIFFICMTATVNKRLKQVMEEQELAAKYAEKNRIENEARKADAEQKKQDAERIKAEKQQEEERQRAEQERKKEEKRMEAELKKKEHEDFLKTVPPEEIERLKSMCADIHAEFKNLLKKYNSIKLDDADDYEEAMDEKVYILSECYRKLDVIQTTVQKYECYYEIDTYEEQEKIEKKAKTLVNNYIKYNREMGVDDFMIDVMEYADSLYFINDFLYDKDEKLNK